MRAMASLLDRLEQELHAAATARPPDAARYAAALEQAVQACRSDPAAAELFDLAELQLDLSAEYQTLERYDDALITADAVIEAGMKMQPDVRCLRAEILMRAGRVADAAPIWAAVLADTPDDVWLYNNAGLEYADVGEHATALGWLTEGLRLALRTGDPERLVDQLLDLRRASLDDLGQPADELQQQAASFLHDKEQARSRRSSPADEPAAEPTGLAGPMTLAWLPAGDYEHAVTLWPELAGSDLVAGPDGPLPHPRYCLALQRKLVGFAEANVPRLAIAPLRVAAFTAWCAERDREPDSAEARAAYAAHLTATGEAAVIAWPPGRNQSCWCGSGRKYKKCCAAPSSAEMP
jgi:tetratricopeptide (TPR) repeat protein